MNGNKLFVDTNIIVYFLKGEPQVVEMILDKELVISIITEIELLAFPNLTEEDEKHIKNLLRECSIVDLKQEVKELTIELRRTYKLKLPVSIIAASAFTHKLPLLTGDKEFAKISELDVILFEI